MRNVVDLMVDNDGSLVVLTSRPDGHGSPGGSPADTTSPRIVDQPHDLDGIAVDDDTAVPTFTGGDELRLSAVASASDSSSLVYAWELNGAVIAGADSPNLDTTIPEDDGRYEYRLRVSNSVGEVLSDPFVVELGAEVTGQDESGRLVDGLLAEWEFDEQGTTIVDTSGVEPALDLTVSDPNLVKWLDGGGIVLDEPVRIGTAGPATKIIDAVRATNEFSLEVWVKPAEVEPEGPGRIAGLLDSRNGNSRNVGIGQGWWLDKGTTDRYEARLQTSSNYNNPVSSARGETVPERTHLVLTRASDGSIRLYVNGSIALEERSEGTLSWQSNIPVMIGNDTDGRFPFQGTIYLVAFYDRALAPTDVSTNYFAGLSRDE
ncbi:MAG: LamG domain-containing protein [Ilumatobacteraceae bacterium]